MSAVGKIRRIFICSALLLGALSGGFAQTNDPNYGATAEQRMHNTIKINAFTKAFNDADYNKASGLFAEIIKSAPAASQNVYVYAANMYKRRIAASSGDAREKYVDSLMLVYDLRMTHFGDHPTKGRGYIANLRATDYANYRGGDAQGVMHFFGEAIRANGDRADHKIVNLYFKGVVYAYQSEFISNDSLVSSYMELARVYDATAAEDENKEAFNTMFLQAAVLDCGIAKKCYAERLDGCSPLVLGTVLNVSLIGQCDLDFTERVGRKMYEVYPHASVLYSVAQKMVEWGERERGFGLLENAIEAAQESEQKSELLLYAAFLSQGEEDSQSAAKYSRRAVEENPANVPAYIKLAESYVMGARCDDFNQRAVYWLAWDILESARYNNGTKSEYNDHLVQSQKIYKSNFPLKGDCFYKGLKEGDIYNVECGWIDGVAKVRGR